MKTLFNENEAEKLFIRTQKSINSFTGAADSARKNIYKLIKIKAYKHLKFDTEKAMFKVLFKGCNKHRSTLNDYKICALVEIELDLDQGKMSTDALVALHQGTDKAYWREIYASACEGLADDKYPTKAIIIKAKEHLSSAQEPDPDLESDEDDQDQFEEDLSEEPDEVDTEEDYEMEKLDDCEDVANLEDDDIMTRLSDKLATTLKRVSRYPMANKKKILRIINPVTDAGKDTLFLLRNLNDDEFDQFKDSIKRACSKKQ